ncbi:MAG: AAA family ATPase [Vicinamibacterales bacterium]
MKHFARFRFDDITGGGLWRDGQRVPLTAKAAALLGCLIDRAGQTVSKETILESVWRGVHVQPENIKVLVHEVRRALGDTPHQARYIRTTPDAGYMFTAPVFSEPTGGLPGAGAITEGPPLIGRHDELAVLDRALSGALNGERRTVLVSGVRGIGKTELCRAFVRAAKGPVRVMYAQCVEHLAPVEAYLPLIDALRRTALDAPEVGQAFASHAPAWASHLPRLLAEPGHGIAELANGTSGPRMLRELIVALEEISLQTPLVVVVDDLQWVDFATLDAVAAIARRRTAAALVLIATSRPLGASRDRRLIRRVLEDLIITRCCTDLPLEPLTTEEVAAYVDSRFGASRLPGLAAAVYRLCGGNPLFTATAIDHLVEIGHLRHDEHSWELTVDLSGAEGAIVERLTRRVRASAGRQLNVHMARPGIHRALALVRGA